MEVHQHSHVNHSNKWKNYLYEFLMLFLAVSAGFFMENLREHNVERNRELQYVKSLSNDLSTDIFNIDSIVTRNLWWKRQADSLYILLTLPDYSDKTALIYYYGRRVSLRDFFYSTDGTIKQLNNAGGLRLISHPDLVDSISRYENKYDDIIMAQQLKELQLRDYRDADCKVFDVRIFENMVSGTKIIIPEGNPKLFSNDPADINVLLMRAHFIKRNNSGILDLLSDLKRQAINIQSMIKSKYNLE